MPLAERVVVFFSWLVLDCIVVGWEQLVADGRPLSVLREGVGQRHKKNPNPFNTLITVTTR